MNLSYSIVCVCLWLLSSVWVDFDQNLNIHFSGVTSVVASLWWRVTLWSSRPAAVNASLFYFSTNSHQFLSNLLPWSVERLLAGVWVSGPSRTGAGSRDRWRHAVLCWWRHQMLCGLICDLPAGVRWWTADECSVCLSVSRRLVSSWTWCEWSLYRCNGVHITTHIINVCIVHCSSSRRDGLGVVRGTDTQTRVSFRWR